jgi:hypothetical protein
MNNGIDISILLPTRGRAQALMSSIQSLHTLAEDFDSIEVLFGVDNDDVVGMENMLHNVCPWIEQNNIKHKIVVFEPQGYNNLHRYVNGLAEHSQGSWLFFWNDDAVMKTTAWDARIRERTGEFKLLSVYTHNDHPYSIFPILPREWFEILGHISQHSSNDAYVSQMAYYLDIFERIDVHCDHNRYDITGINNDATYQQRRIMEGDPSQPGDLNHPDMVKLRTDDVAKLATWMQDQGLDLTFFVDAWEGRQDPWIKMRANDTNNQVDATVRRVNTE